MKSRRGLLFFWISQVLLCPTWVCFFVTLTMRYYGRTLPLWRVGVVTGLVQIPFTALAVVFTMASGIGELLPRAWIRALYVEVTIAALMITLVLFWHGVYRF